MKGRLQSYILLSVMALVSALAVSCEGYRPYYDPLEGRWVLAYDEYGYIDTSYSDVYCFYSDGTGYLDYYDEWGRNFIEDFYWNATGDYISLRYYGGGHEGYYYYFRNGDLILWDGYNRYRYWGFRRY